MAAQKAIESAISEDCTISDTARSLLNTCIAYSVNFMDGIVQFVDTTLRELTISRCSAKKAWYLLTTLARRVLEDVFEPCIGKLGVFRLKITFR